MPAKRSPDLSIRIISTRASTSAREDEIHQEMRFKMIGEIIRRVGGSEDGKGGATSGDKGNDKCSRRDERRGGWKLNPFTQSFLSTVNGQCAT